MIEKKIQNLLDMISSEIRLNCCGRHDTCERCETDYRPINNWSWSGKLDGHSCATRMINQMIRDAEQSECLLSPSKYIREAKKHYLRTEQERFKWKKKA